jgi:hypothetical protein
VKGLLRRLPVNNRSRPASKRREGVKASVKWQEGAD